MGSFTSVSPSFVSKILGHPQINLIVVNVKRDGDRLQLISEDGTICVDVPDRMRQPLLDQNLQQFTLGIRPMHLRPLAEDASTGTNECYGVVYVYERLGTKGILSATVGGQKLNVITPIEMDFAIDQPVRLGIETNHIMVFNNQTEQNILFAQQG